MNLQILNRIPTVEEFLLLREHVGWGAPDAEASATSLSNALYTVCLEKEGELIGMGRIVGDGGLFFYIQDLIVKDSHRGNGYANILMENLLNYLRENVKDGAFVGLFSAKNVEGLYEKFGFMKRPNDQFGAGMHLPIRRLKKQNQSLEVTLLAEARSAAQLTSEGICREEKSI